ncbi:amidase [Paraferrimonas sp. SM1919]|uniref:amidase n=1 Tax=Paraferrimonas sp. SM1919 TaxID=2662263 RepID=UPI0013D008E4|nr:amidase [Paraferrimonas sp. SM1919]
MSAHNFSATKLLSLYRNQKLSPVEVAQDYQNQFNRINSKVNAFSFPFFERAIEQAKVAEQRYSDASYRALEGLQVAFKDETYIEGEPMTNGSWANRNTIATSTDPVPELLFDQGVINIGRTTTPEFSVASVTWSNLWGISRSPWNTAMTCGGSSGGSAIAVATGMASFANGTDIGGSLRIPAAMCGVYGYKPPHGRVAEIAPYNIDLYCHHGLITRTLDDMLLAYPHIRGSNWIDSHSFVPDSNPSLAPTKPLSQLKVAVSVDLGFYQVDKDIQDNLLNTAKVLAATGAEVELVELDWDSQVIQTAKVHQRAMMGQKLKKEHLNAPHFDKLTPYVQQYLQAAAKTTLDDVLEANMHLCKMWDELAKVFKDYDLLLCPTVATTNVAADFDYSKDTLQINGVEVDANKGWFMTYPFNTFGQCPVLSMPNGFCENGMPSSLQLVGRPYQEEHIFVAAKEIERQQLEGWYSKILPQFK